MGGAPITTVFKNGPCKAAGVKPGDVLLSIDSEPTYNTRSVIRIIGWDKNIGDKITLLIGRAERVESIKTRTIEIRDGETRNVTFPSTRYNRSVIDIPVTLMKTTEKLER